MTNRPLLVLILSAAAMAGCNSLSSENEGQLATYLDNAEQYFDGAQWNRAYQQWGKALELDPSNEGARLGQAMCQYQAGREENVAALKPLTEATTMLEKMSHEDFDKMQWKVELGLALVHQRWCDLYDRKIRKIAEDEKKGVAVDAKELATCRAEFDKHVEIASKSFEKVLSGPEKEPRDRLTCWVGLAQIAYWRDDYPTSLKYCNLYLEQVLRSKRFWKEQADNSKHPANTEMFKGKYTGASLQEAELRDLMGAVLFKMGREDDASAELDKVIEMFPQRATAYLNRGILRQKRGDYDLARSDFKKFLNTTDLADNDPSILEATRRLEEVEHLLEKQEASDAVRPPDAR
jgi:tetratricopeptide (TPR) repeat protein